MATQPLTPYTDEMREHYLKHPLALVYILGYASRVSFGLEMPDHAIRLQMRALNNKQFSVQPASVTEAYIQGVEDAFGVAEEIEQDKRLTKRIRGEL